MNIFFNQSEFWDFFVRLSVAILCGSLIGAERQWRGRNAGLRTNVLVCVGAAVFTYLSKMNFGASADASRVAAQIVSGIGFLGAGVIMRREDNVQGLNTATTIWTAAALGMASGLAAYDVAILSTLAILGIQILYRPLSASIDYLSAQKEPKRFYHFVAVVDADGVGSLQDEIGALLQEHGLELVTSRVRSEANRRVSLQFGVLATAGVSTRLEPLFASFLQRDGIHELSWHKEAVPPMSRLLKRRPAFDCAANAQV